eukprot:TRINITY_DN13436_c0_g1_i3.p1 TRINITY_DN13436_c0_g1~~TRINITY_DN13436_c0_g1_i3.p1  ORF type:complete len:455 (+),score=95.58 TRINITY_DN13436_c0_g1_i3:82-1365(+)
MHHVLPLGGGLPLQPRAPPQPILSQWGHIAPRRHHVLNPNRATKNMLEMDSAAVPTAVKLPWSSLPIGHSGPAPTETRHAAGSTSAVVGARAQYQIGGKHCGYHDQLDSGEVVVAPSQGQVPHKRLVAGAEIGLGRVEDRRHSVLGNTPHGFLGPLHAAPERRLHHPTAPPTGGPSRPCGRRQTAARAEPHDPAPTRPAGRRQSKGYLYHDAVSGAVVTNQNASSLVASVVRPPAEGEPSSSPRRQLRGVPEAPASGLEQHSAVPQAVQDGYAVPRGKQPVQGPWTSDNVVHEGDYILPLVEAETKPGCRSDGQKYGLRTRRFSQHTGTAAPEQMAPRRPRKGLHTGYDYRSAEYSRPMPAVGAVPSPRLRDAGQGRSSPRAAPPGRDGPAPAGGAPVPPPSAPPPESAPPPAPQPPAPQPATDVAA